jgi:multiple sugar transport system ATP-binding protein
VVTVRAPGDIAVVHGDTVYITPDPSRIHRFDAQGKAIR